MTHVLTITGRQLGLELGAFIHMPEIYNLYIKQGIDQQKLWIGIPDGHFIMNILLLYGPHITNHYQSE